MVVRGHRPPVPADMPSDYAVLMRASWDPDAAMRPSSSDVSQCIASLVAPAAAHHRATSDRDERRRNVQLLGDVDFAATIERGGTAVEPSRHERLKLRTGGLVQLRNAERVVGERRDVRAEPSRFEALVLQRVESASSSVGAGDDSMESAVEYSVNNSNSNGI